MSEREIREPGVVEEVASGRLGERVRKLRGEKGLTLDGLAARSGVSRAMISKIERGEKSPTLVVAAKVAEGLGVGLSQLVGAEEKRRVVVVRRRDRQTLRDPETGLERQLLSSGPSGRGVEFVRYVIPEGTPSAEMPPRRQGAEEHVVVERGRLRITLGDEEHVLEEGDVARFEPDLSRRFDNAGGGECSFYLVLDPG